MGWMDMVLYVFMMLYEDAFLKEGAEFDRSVRWRLFGNLCPSLSPSRSAEPSNRLTSSVPPSSMSTTSLVPSTASSVSLPPSETDHITNIFTNTLIGTKIINWNSSSSIATENEKLLSRCRDVYIYVQGPNTVNSVSVPTLAMMSIKIKRRR